MASLVDLFKTEGCDCPVEWTLNKVIKLILLVPLMPRTVTQLHDSACGYSSCYWDQSNLLCFSLWFFWNCGTEEASSSFKTWAGRDERPTIILIRGVAQSLRNVAGHMCTKLRWGKNPMRRLHGLQFSQKQSCTTSSKIRSDQANLIGMFTWGGSNRVGVKSDRYTMSTCRMMHLHGMFSVLYGPY